MEPKAVGFADPAGHPADEARRLIVLAKNQKFPPRQE